MTARVACVCVPDLGLQVLLRDRPAWRDAPVALVDEDRPDAPLMVLNAHARHKGLTVGMRHGVARNLIPALRTAVVHVDRGREVMADLATVLREFSPKVELDAREGVFVIDPTGMGRLHRGARTWALSVRRAVASRGFTCAVVVGFDRRTTQAIALHARGVVVARSIHDELGLAGDVPLDALGLPVRSVTELDALGITTLGELWSLPAETVRHRFGSDVADVRAWASRDVTLPVQPDTPREPSRTVIEVEPPDDDLARLLFAVRGALHLLVAQLASRGEAVAALDLTLHLEDRSRAAHHIEPASPTRDVALLIELARLRLTEQSLTAKVSEAEVTVAPAALRGEQLALFTHERARDRGSVMRAIARVRAAFGERSVTRARLRDAHLPEAGFAWERFELPPTSPAMERMPEGEATPLIRRLVMPPREVSPAELRALSPVPRDAAVLPWLRAVPENDAAHDDFARGDPWSMVTPSRVSGGWWARTVERDYYYAEARDGSLLWVFFDRVRDRWFLHGIVD